MSKKVQLPSALLKRRTRQHVIADLAVNHVERVILECGHTPERTRHDYGIDMFVSSYDKRGFVEPGYLLVQVKATERLRQIARGKQLAVRVETAHLAAWMADPMPLILVLYDADSRSAFWLYVQEEIDHGGLKAGWRRPNTPRCMCRWASDSISGPVERLVAAKSAAVKRTRTRE